MRTLVINGMELPVKIEEGDLPPIRGHNQSLARRKGPSIGYANKGHRRVNCSDRTSPPARDGLELPAELLPFASVSAGIAHSLVRDGAIIAPEAQGQQGGNKGGYFILL